MESITVHKATEKDIKALSEKLCKLLEDKTGKLYQDSVMKFGIPDEHVKKTFSEEALLRAVQLKKATFYLARKNRSSILGFAQIIEQDSISVELDRIVVFPEYERKGIGTKLLKRAVADQKKRKTKTIVVMTGRDENHARAFYEKNGFKQVKEEMLEFPWGKKIPIVVYHFELEHRR